jgi:uncharacterized membrane protein
VADEQRSRSGELDLDRFLTFLDAIVAIAITLLVLPLVELPMHVDEYDSVADLVRHNQAAIWAFLLSFEVVPRFWFVQHRAVRRMVGYHGAVGVLLMLWTLTIVFLPFPTGLVAEAGDSAVTKVLYIGTMVVSTALIAGVQAVLARHRDLTEGDPDPSAGIANAVMLLLALAITLLVPATSYYPLLLLLLADRLAAGWRRVRGRASVASDDSTVERLLP